MYDIAVRVRENITRTSERRRRIKTSKYVCFVSYKFISVQCICKRRNLANTLSPLRALISIDRRPSSNAERRGIYVAGWVSAGPCRWGMGDVLKKSGIGVLYDYVVTSCVDDADNAMRGRGNVEQNV